MQHDLARPDADRENGMDVVQKEMGGTRRTAGDKPASTKEILSLLYQQGFRCAYTGEVLTPETTAGDHKIPVSRGGGHSIKNIALVKREVNTAKHTLTVEEFVLMCKKVAAHFADGSPLQIEIPFPVPADLIPPDANPAEILIRLGYIDAAEEVNKMRQQIATYKRNARHGGRKLTPEEYQTEVGQKIMMMREEIGRLRVMRSKLRQQTGWAGEDTIESCHDQPTPTSDTAKSS